MEYRVLGPIEALDGERRLPLGGPKQRAVLAVLLLGANRVVSRTDLVEAVWPEGPPPTAATALQVYVSRLRKTLPAGVLETRPAGYLLHVELGVLEDRIDADLALGHHAGLVGELEGLVARHPLRERLRGQLMLALYRAGRQAEALEQYRTARAALREQLGLDPGAALQRLHGTMLRQEPELELRRSRATVLFAILTP